MEFNAVTCNTIAKNIYNEKMTEKYKDIVSIIKRQAEAGNFIAFVNNMSSECCEWLLRLKFRISLLKPGEISEKIGWHWISGTYYKEELQKYGHNGIKIDWEWEW